jgi:hypothetical protein
MEGHGVVNGDCLNQRLTSNCWCGYRFADVHNNGWSWVLLLRGWRVGVRLSLGVKQKDGIDMEQFILTPTGPNLPLSALRGWVGEKRLGRLVVVELIQCVGIHWVNV